jgi:hypothetical protein
MAKKSELVKYVSFYLARELIIVKMAAIAAFSSALGIKERTLIYKYSEDGYEIVNRMLRDS